MKKGKLILVVIVSIVVIVGLVLGGFLLLGNSEENDNNRQQDGLENGFQNPEQNIGSVDENMQRDIDGQFSGNRNFVVLPEPPVMISRGGTAGFAFSVANKGNSEKTYHYSIDARTSPGCSLTDEEASSLILSGKSSPEEGVTIKPGEEMPAQKVILETSKNTPLCSMVFTIDFSSRADENVKIEIVSESGLF